MEDRRLWERLKERTCRTVKNERIREGGRKTYHREKKEIRKTQERDEGRKTEGDIEGANRTVDNEGYKRKRKKDNTGRKRWEEGRSAVEG